ncbi:Hypothetical protein CINCED_3A009004 [Cinara cedri]|uniref:Uncharacterized protein n=1 Tax=Cinara cedri TaxID=506608 RepID=A0A5E4NHG4_9HEMI|nr:Hypothetical protein CINCED_3A009004 [Cinara cedri]
MANDTEFVLGIEKAKEAGLHFVQEYLEILNEKPNIAFLYHINEDLQVQLSISRYPTDITDNPQPTTILRKNRTHEEKIIPADMISTDLDSRMDTTVNSVQNKIIDPVKFTNNIYIPPIKNVKKKLEVPGEIAASYWRALTAPHLLPEITENNETHESYSTGMVTYNQPLLDVSTESDSRIDTAVNSVQNKIIHPVKFTNNIYIPPIENVKKKLDVPGEIAASYCRALTAHHLLPEITENNINPIIIKDNETATSIPALKTLPINTKDNEGKTPKLVPVNAKERIILEPLPNTSAKNICPISFKNDSPSNILRLRSRPVQTYYMSSLTTRERERFFKKDTFIKRQYRRIRRSLFKFKLLHVIENPLFFL